MRKAIQADKKKFIQIIAEAFDTNPSVNWVIKQDENRMKRIRAVADYAFDTAVLRGGAFISSDETGIALCYKYNNKANLLKDILNQAKLAIKGVGLNRVTYVLKRESYIGKQRPSDGEFLYFWFFGVTPQGRGNGAALELKDYIFNIAEEQKLPVYLETSVPKNRKVYERYGFKMYHSWGVESEDLTLWFMKRDF